MPKEVSPEEFEVRKAVLGIDAETFRRTNLGQYIYDRISIQEEHLIEELISASPADVAKGAELRADIRMHRMLPKFIDEAIGSGHVAERNIRQMEEHTD